MKRRLLACVLLFALGGCLLCACKKEDTATHPDHTHEGPWLLDMTQPTPVLTDTANPFDTPDQRLPLSEIPETRSVTVFGSTYTGQRLERKITDGSSYVTDVYETEDMTATFGVRSDTGEVVSLTLSPDVRETFLLPDLPDAEGRAVSLAYTLALELIDPSAYQMDISSREDSCKLEGVTYTLRNYDIVFRKELGGLRTVERLHFTVNSKGMLCAFYAIERGSFDALSGELFSAAVSERAVQLMVAQLGSPKGRTYLSHEIKRPAVLRLTTDGRYILSLFVSITWQDDQTNHKYDGVSEVYLLLGTK